jgi:hypothetical protein
MPPLLIERNQTHQRPAAPGAGYHSLADDDYQCVG